MRRASYTRLLRRARHAPSCLRHSRQPAAMLYRGRMRRSSPRAVRVGLLFAVSLATPMSNAWANEVVGVARCRGCHPAAFAQWVKTPHAQAAARLTPAQRVDARCASCHSTDAARGHLHVQCESCHGPGSAYWPEGIMRDPVVARALGLEKPDTAQLCRQCHGPHAHMGQRFDFPAALLHIRHEHVRPGRSKGH